MGGLCVVWRLDEKFARALLLLSDSHGLGSRVSGLRLWQRLSGWSTFVLNWVFSVNFRSVDLCAGSVFHRPSFVVNIDLLPMVV